MKSYLSLVPISARVHRRQNRMTFLCIVLSVFLVTAIFSMADMVLRVETDRMAGRHGSWHIKLSGVPEEEISEIGGHPGVVLAGWSDTFNVIGDKPYYIDERTAVLCGMQETWLLQFEEGTAEGNFPQNDHEVMLSTNARDIMDYKTGDSITLNTPAGSGEYVISGFSGYDADYYQGQTYMIAVYMTREAYQALLSENGAESEDSSCYIQFESAREAKKAETELMEQYGLSTEEISENTAVMGAAGVSGNEAVKSTYGAVAVLFVLVLLAGVLMISGSMNSNVAQRTKFFGMLRCIGASRRQIIRFVRLEALNWCRTAVPAGVLLGTAASVGICAAMRFGIGGEWSEMPLSVSVIGVASGAVVGIVTVLLAARAPAKRAAGVPPMAAVSGAVENTRQIKHAAKQSFLKIETVLGIHHASASKKNWCLMTGSFALTIILFLSFSVGMDFVRGLLPTLRSWQPDLTISGYANSLNVDKGMVDEIRKLPGVEHVYADVYLDNVPASSPQRDIDHVNIVSYDDYMLDCTEKDITVGDLSGVYGDNGKAMTIYNKDNPLKAGDTIELEGTELEITCAAADGLFASDLIVICSEETFERIMGKHNYVMLLVQLDENAPEQTVKQIASLADKDQIFTDHRRANREAVADYWAMRFMGYGFLVIIGMITLFYIMNSIAMSVSARVRQYGAMRAVGMDGRQLSGMIAAEAFTYAVSGLAAGCAAGLPVHRFLHGIFLTRHFGAEWSVPALLLGVSSLFVIASALAAVYAPSRRIRNMAVCDAVNEL